MKKMNKKNQIEMDNKTMQETLPGGGFHGGEQQETLPGGGFHGGEILKKRAMQGVIRRSKGL